MTSGLVFASLAAAALASIQLNFTSKNEALDTSKFHHQNKLATIGSHVYSRDLAELLGDSIPSTVINPPTYNFYYTTLEFGTPGQRIDVILDTGSPITWAYGPNITYKNARQFFPNVSETFQDINSTLSASYGAGQYFGTWGADSVQALGFSSRTLDNFSFGLVDDFSSAAGVPGMLGLSPHIAGAGPDSYKSLPEALYDSGLIDSPAFSLNLNEWGGTLILGGVDLGQVQQPIYEFDIVNASTGYNNFYNIGLTGLGFNGDNQTLAMPALIDSGSPMSLLPPSFVKKIGESLGLTYYKTYSAYYTNGSISDFEGTVTFTIGAFSSEIDVKELFVPGEYIWSSDGPQGVKALSLVSSPNFILGDAFLKSAYATFDGVNRKIYLARRNTQPVTIDIISAGNDLQRLVQPGKLQPSAISSLAYLTAIPSGSTSAPLFANNEWVGTESRSMDIKADSALIETASGSPNGTTIPTVAASTTAASGSAATASGSSSSSSSAASSSSKANAASLPSYSIGAVLAGLAVLLF